MINTASILIKYWYSYKSDIIANYNYYGMLFLWDGYENFWMHVRIGNTWTYGFAFCRMVVPVTTNNGISSFPFSFALSLTYFSHDFQASTNWRYRYIWLYFKFLGVNRIVQNIRCDSGAIMQSSIIDDIFHTFIVLWFF